MALDSSAKRRSVIGMGVNFRPLTIPDGSNLDAFEQRIHTLGYSTALGAPTAVDGGAFGIPAWMLLHED